MGCWNGTDNLGGLPIRAGSKVKASIIKTIPYEIDANSFCYSNGIAETISFNIDCEYNDYGGVENVDEESVSVMLLRGYLNKCFETEGRISVSGTDENFTLDGITMQDFINDYIARGAVSINSHDYGGNEKRCSVGLMFSSTIMFDSIYNAINSSDDYDNSHMAHDTLDLDAKYFVEDVICREKSEDDEYSIIFRGWDEKCRSVGKYGNLVRQFSNGNSVNHGAFHAYFRLLSQFKDRPDEVSEMIADLMKLTSVMSSIRASWSPKGGAGSQGYDESAFIGLRAGIEKELQDYHHDMIREWECIEDNGNFIKGEKYKLTDIVLTDTTYNYKFETHDNEKVAGIIDEKTRYKTFGEKW